MRHKCSLTSIKLCNTAHQRAEFLVIQKCSSCVLPNPVLGARLGELVLDGCPRILYPDQLQFTAFPPAPSPRPAVYPGQVVGCFGLECCDLQVCPSCHPVVLSCNPSSAALPWGHFTVFASPCPGAVQAFGVCCAPGVDVVLLSLCQSVVGLVLTVKNLCDVSNPVQVRFHFCCFYVCEFDFSASVAIQR